MKNLKSIGKELGRKAQQNIFGGIISSSGCYSNCTSGSCGDPNHYCKESICIYDNIVHIQSTCQCISGVM